LKVDAGDLFHSLLENDDLEEEEEEEEEGKEERWTMLLKRWKYELRSRVNKYELVWALDEGRTVDREPTNHTRSLHQQALSRGPTEKTWLCRGEKGHLGYLLLRDWIVLPGTSPSHCLLCQHPLSDGLVHLLFECPVGTTICGDRRERAREIYERSSFPLGVKKEEAELLQELVGELWTAREHARLEGGGAEEESEKGPEGEARVKESEVRRKEPNESGSRRLDGEADKSTRSATRDTSRRKNEERVPPTKVRRKEEEASGREKSRPRRSRRLAKEPPEMVIRPPSKTWKKASVAKLSPERMRMKAEKSYPVIKEEERWRRGPLGLTGFSVGFPLEHDWNLGEVHPPPVLAWPHKL
jgi:hypothetical protein